MALGGILDGYRLSIREQFFTSIVLNLLQLLREFGTSGLEFAENKTLVILFFCLIS